MDFLENIKHGNIDAVKNHLRSGSLDVDEHWAMKMAMRFGRTDIVELLWPFIDPLSDNKYFLHWAIDQGLSKIWEKHAGLLDTEDLLRVFETRLKSCDFKGARQTLLQLDAMGMDNSHKTKALELIFSYGDRDLILDGIQQHDLANNPHGLKIFSWNLAINTTLTPQNAKDIVSSLFPKKASLTILTSYIQDASKNGNIVLVTSLLEHFKENNRTFHELLPILGNISDDSLYFKNTSLLKIALSFSQHGPNSFDFSVAIKRGTRYKQYDMLDIISNARPDLSPVIGFNLAAIGDMHYGNYIDHFELEKLKHIAQECPNIDVIKNIHSRQKEIAGADVLINCVSQRSVFMETFLFLNAHSSCTALEKGQILDGIFSDGSHKLLIPKKNDIFLNQMDSAIANLLEEAEMTTQCLSLGWNMCISFPFPQTIDVLMSKGKAVEYNTFVLALDAGKEDKFFKKLLLKSTTPFETLREHIINHYRMIKKKEFIERLEKLWAEVIEEKRAKMSEDLEEDRQRPQRIVKM